MADLQLPHCIMKIKSVFYYFVNTYVFTYMYLQHFHFVFFVVVVVVF